MVLWYADAYVNSDYFVILLEERNELHEFGVDGKFDASEEIAVGVRSLGSDVDLALSQEGDEGRNLGQHGFGTWDRHGGVLVERATARKSRFGDDVPQNSSALAILGDPC